MSPISDLLDRTRQALSQARFSLAEHLARQAIDLDPTLAAPWSLLTDALSGQSKSDEALAACSQSCRLSPEDPDALFRLARLHAEAGLLPQARDLFHQVLRLRPDHPDTLVQLGILLARAGQLDKALVHLRRAIELQPDSPRAHLNLGVALAQCGRLEDARLALVQSLALAPNYAEAAYDLGNVLSSLGRKAEAISTYRNALALHPDHPGVLNNLGLLLQKTNRPAEAVVLLSQAVRLRPEAAEAHDNLGLALADLGRFADALDCHERALRLDPRSAQAHTNLACVLEQRGRIDEALASFELALCLDPTSASTRYNRSLCLLQSGDWLTGFPEYESRWSRKGLSQRRFTRPRWDGSTLAGRTILLWTEQGLGDAIQFVRYAVPLTRLGARVVLSCPGYLQPLLSCCPGIDRVVAEGEPLPTYDMQVPLMSLPGLLGTTLKPGPRAALAAPSVERLPAEVPYLSVDPERMERWRARLGRTTTFRVGVVWQGNPHFPRDRWRSVPLSHFEVLAEVPGVELVSLQRTHGLDQLDHLDGRFHVTVLSQDLDATGAFLDTAAVAKCLDLVISADTAIGHLAGALGVPTWLALSAVSDWRWLRDRDDTPWYPSTRLFRQARLGHWDEVFDRMAEVLHRQVETRGRRGVVRIETNAGEVLDRWTILRIKAERIEETDRRRHVMAELSAVERAVAQLGGLDMVEGPCRELHAVNEKLWDVEDDLRECERRGDFGEDFVRLARSVYQLNEERGRLKRHLAEAFDAPWIDEKQYGRQKERPRGEPGVP